MEWHHVYPLNDFRDHDTDDKNCWCHPYIDDEDMLVIHNAMDGREHVENGKQRTH